LTYLVGALPYLTEIFGYSGPVITTTPTKALMPYMLEDYSRVITENQKKDKQVPEEANKNAFYLSYTAQQIKACGDKISTMNLHEVKVVNGIKIKTYYAGHILGACMFLIEYNGLKVVYTGDFNCTADRHLGAAWIEKCKPNVVITESTYATTVRDSKK
jgi:integrator complex subunit 11